MNHTPITSTLLASAAYSRERSLLEVRLRSGEIYRYFDVPKRTYAELLAADSKGEYFNACIRKHFIFQKIRSHTSAATDSL